MAFKKIKPIYIYIISAVLIFIIITAIILSTIFSNPYLGKQTNIANLSEYTRGLKSDKETVERIKYNLYEAITRNTPNIDATKLSDVLIRDKTFSQDYNEETKVFSVKYIVDIDSIKQTYRIAYEWSEDKNAQLNEWGTYVKCPTKEQLKYADFNCNDMFTEMYGTNDPIIEVLPHYGTLYDIIPNTSNGILENIEIKIFACTSNITDIAEDNARNWLKDHDISSDQYEITVTYCNL